MDLADLILLFAIPWFLGMMALEYAVTRAGALQERRLRGEIIGYDRKDTRTSLAMGVGSLVINGMWRAVEVALLAGVAVLSPLDLGHGWAGWLVALVAVDFMYYWEHRAGHEVRIVWAAHVVHHSSQRYNLSTALRQTWTGEYTFLFLIPVVALGTPVELVLAAWSINLLYQFWIHTEAINRMWGWFEFVFNTPSHHRVHHGSQSQYLDRNYAGILILWDRLFRTFEPEGERVVYGLTKNISTHNPLRVATHEFVAIGRDVRAASSWRDRAGYLFRGPGWAPATATAPATDVATAAPAVPATPPRERESV
jgi:sterol desaturase/sphingolipid hydroxylase (fatty acid hydroxylase superfamily)